MSFLRPHELQHARPPCPSPTPRVHPNPCPLSQWCHPAISSSVVPVSSCSQSFSASGSFPMSQLFTSGGQSIGVSASVSVLPMNTHDWSHFALVNKLDLGWFLVFYKRSLSTSFCLETWTLMGWLRESCVRNSAQNHRDGPCQHLCSWAYCFQLVRIL